MAGDWIKMEMDLPEKPEVIRMACLLSMDRFAIVGRLHRVWSWWNKHSVDGHAPGVTETFLDELAGCDGFSAALREVDWLQARSGSLAVPHFDRHNGQSAKTRAQANERKKVSRTKRDGCHASSVTKTRPEKRREEKREGNAAHPPPSEDGEGAGIARPTLEQARGGAAAVGVAQDVAEEWWNCREASDWTKGAGGGGTVTVGRNWQADLKTYANRMAKPDHRSEKASREYAEPPQTLPELK